MQQALFKQPDTVKMGKESKYKEKNLLWGNLHMFYNSFSKNIFKTKFYVKIEKKKSNKKGPKLWDIND